MKNINTKIMENLNKGLKENTVKKIIPPIKNDPNFSKLTNSAVSNFNLNIIMPFKNQICMLSSQVESDTFNFFRDFKKEEKERKRVQRQSSLMLKNINEQRPKN
jgi:DNA integrity scanning protein DisA with diadenylate cyclase activity